MRDNPDCVRSTSGSQPWKRGEEYLSDYHDTNYKLTGKIEHLSFLLD